jgi:flagellar motor switch protein FliG
VVQRIATIDRTDPRVLEALERILQEKFKAMGAREAVAAGGVDQVVGLLNVISRSVERHVVSTLDDTHPELAEEIKKRMFVFEDIVLLDDTAMSAVLKRANREDLLLSVKAVVEPVKEKVLGNLPKEQVQGFKDEVQKIGRVRLSDVEAAQQRIVSIIREMEAEGAIVVARADETVI